MIMMVNANLFIEISNVFKTIQNCYKKLFREQEKLLLRDFLPF